MGAGKKVWGYYPAGDVWLPLQVDVNGKVVVDMSGINLGDLGDVNLTGIADGYMLYWDAATSLWKAVAPISRVATNFAGQVYQDATGYTGFYANINGNPTSTSVVYDGETRESSIYFNAATDLGVARVVLHNLTRGNERLIKQVNIGTNTITTEPSTDDWADNDIITTRSQTNTQGGEYAWFVDLDFSTGNPIPANTTAILVAGYFLDSGAANKRLFFHPYESYSAAKRLDVRTQVANVFSNFILYIPITNLRCTYSISPTSSSSVIWKIMVIADIAPAT